MTTKHDSHKPNYALLPLDALEQVVRVLEFGAKKYTPDGWRTVPNGEQRYLAAMLRHVAAYQAGEKTDPESGLPHLAHAVCSGIMSLWHSEQTKGGEKK